MRARPYLPAIASLIVAVASLPLALLPASSAGSPTVVISQVYGGGGNSGAPYDSKFVELFNRGPLAADIGGWSIQYASATGTTNFASNPVVRLPDVMLPPGGYFLVALAGGANGAPLPAPDASGTINPAAGSGKILLAANTTGLACNGGSTPCSADDLALIVDLVGYGSANFFEGSGPAPTLSNATAALRRDGGCQDTDDNAADFSAGAPLPRNSLSPVNPCQPNEPSPTPAPTPTPSPTPSPTPTPGPTPSPTLTPAPSPSEMPAPSPTPTPSPAPSPTPEPSAPGFAFDGFGRPIANPPAVNSAKAGSSVVLHFSLGGDHGLDVIAHGFPVSVSHACADAATDASEIANSPGASGLNYDSLTDTYTFVWKTDRSWAGTCRLLVLKLIDGSYHHAEFTFR